MSDDRRTDPRTGSTLILSPEGLTVLRPDGSRGYLPAPEGYSLSHFGEGIDVVGRGEAPRDGWWDWHFEPDLETGAFRRLGPAY